jgi:hypothetical protein
MLEKSELPEDFDVQYSRSVISCRIIVTLLVLRTCLTSHHCRIQLQSLSYHHRIHCCRTASKKQGARDRHARAAALIPVTNASVQLLITVTIEATELQPHLIFNLEMG